MELHCDSRMEESAQEPEAAKDITSVDQLAEEQQSKEEVPVITPEERLWGVVKSNPADFNAWTELILETEKSEDILKIRICYDAFLTEFPLCYGYWKKYADYEAKFSTSQEILEVYERAVKAVTHSVDIWLHYCTYAADKFEVEEMIRHLSACLPSNPWVTFDAAHRFVWKIIETTRLFERGVSSVGTDYLSYGLWDKYLDYVCRQQDWSLALQLDTRILEIPLQQLDRHFGSFKQNVINKPGFDIKSSDRRREGTPRDADELEKFLLTREILYKKTKEWDVKIRDFENAIRRPYFHVKPLDDGQLGNWHRYLDFLEKEADMPKVVKVFERCLIACANYPEYWIRYVEYLENQNNVEMANDALLRATQTFVKRLPEIHVFAARFKERTGEAAAARSIYKFIITELVPGHLESIVKSAHFEKRQGDIDGACSVFESAIEAEKAKEESRTLPSIYVQYIQFLSRVGRIAKAKEVLQAALQQLPSSKAVVETAIYHEYHSTGHKQSDKLNAVVQQATKAEENSLSHADREELSNLYLEFIDAFGDVNAVIEAESRHEGLFPFRKSYIEFRRRLAHDSSFNERAKKNLSPTAAAQAYGTQWAAYQAYPQNWQQQQQQQQAPQAQWNAYSQQAGYAYGSYSAYGAQPAQAAAAATTAYTAAYGSAQDMNGWTGNAATTGSW